MRASSGGSIPTPCATRVTRARAAPTMSLPASAKRSWISRNTRRISGCAPQEERSSASSVSRSKSGLLAGGELRDGGLHLARVQPQPLHHGPRGFDLALGDPAVGLGHVPHDAEGAAEELFGRVDERRAQRARVVPVTDAPRPRRPPRAEEGPERTTNEFSRPLHMVYGSKLEYHAAQSPRNPPAQP